MITFRNVVLLCFSVGFLASTELVFAQDGKAEPQIVRRDGERFLKLPIRVVDEAGNSVSGAVVKLGLLTSNSTDLKPLQVTQLAEGYQAELRLDQQFNRHRLWLHYEAESSDGRLASRVLASRQFRTASSDGVVLTLLRPSRSIRFRVTDNGQPKANVSVRAYLSRQMWRLVKTDSHGHADFPVFEHEKLWDVSAWTEDGRVGGFQTSRKPVLDPMSDEFEIKLIPSIDRSVRLIDSTTKQGVAGVKFELKIASAPPNFQYINGLPNRRQTTNEYGDALCVGGPRWESEHTYVNLIDSGWSTDGSPQIEAGVLVFPIRQIATDHFVEATGTLAGRGLTLPEGFRVEIVAAQRHEKGSSRVQYAWTDEKGEYRFRCVPGFTYCVYIDDETFQSEVRDLVPISADGQVNTPANFSLLPTEELEIQVTKGPKSTPMGSASVTMKVQHEYEFSDGEKTRYRVDGPSWTVHTESDGRTTCRVPVGQTVQASFVHANERSRARLEELVVVQEGGANQIHLHLEIAEPRTVVGSVSLPQGLQRENENLNVVFGSLDGETDVRVIVDAEVKDDWSFTLETQAFMGAVYATTGDGKFFGYTRLLDTSKPSRVTLGPTATIQGQLLNRESEPMADEEVRIPIWINGNSPKNQFRTSMLAQTLKATTDSAGYFQVSGVPRGIPLRVEVRNPADVNNWLRPLSFDIGLEEDQKELFVQLGGTQRYYEFERRLRSAQADSRINGYRTLVMVQNQAPQDQIKKLLDPDQVEALRGCMKVTQRLGEVEDMTFDSWFESTGESAADVGTMLAIILNLDGDVVGKLRLTLEGEPSESVKNFSNFLDPLIPTAKNAEEKWRRAFNDAQQTNRRVWVRDGHNYCGPCIILSRWIDKNRVILERDYVLLKIDTGRDVDWIEVRERITGGKSGGSPFHAIFDAKGTRLIDSESPEVGNIGCAGGPETNRYLRKMLLETRLSLTNQEVDSLIQNRK